STQLHSNSGGNLSKLQNITDVVIMALTISFLFLKHQDSAVAQQWISNNILVGVSFTNSSEEISRVYLHHLMHRKLSKLHASTRAKTRSKCSSLGKLPIEPDPYPCPSYRRPSPPTWNSTRAMFAPR
ncbi:hypothetical protein M758_3G171500, partial [Ceratodon purpureus]